MRLVLRLAFLCVLALNSLLLASCLPFEINLNCVWYRHVSDLPIHNKLPIAISVASYSQNQTSITISPSSLPNSESFVRKAGITVIPKLCFHRFLFHIKVEEKTC